MFKTGLPPYLNLRTFGLVLPIISLVAWCVMFYFWRQSKNDSLVKKSTLVFALGGIVSVVIMFGIFAYQLSQISQLNVIQ